MGILKIERLNDLTQITQSTWAGFMPLSVGMERGMMSTGALALYLHERYPIGDGPQIYLAVHERQVLSKSTKIAMLPNSMAVAQSWFIYSIGHNLITSSFLRHFLQMEGNQLS